MKQILRYRKWRKIIKNSGMFDPEHYLFSYPDVRLNDIDPIVHYIKFGAKEGRKPNKGFDTEYYLKSYPDVEQAGINPLVHYILYGKSESRKKEYDFHYNHVVEFGSIKNKNICIFVHYDKDDIIDEYVLYYLRSIKAMSSVDIVFVTVCKNISRLEINKLDGLVTKCIVRDNIGYDFGSYKVGFDYLENNRISYDTLIFVNDSVYGELSSLYDVFNEMQKNEYDMWGMTDNNYIHYHLQSYFLVFNKRSLRSSVFRSFWSEMKVIKNKKLLIEEYEIGLNKRMIRGGFTLGVYCPINKVREELIKRKNDGDRVDALSARIENDIFNVTHIAWDVLIEKFKYPFIKIELLRDNPISIKNLYKVNGVLSKSYDTRVIVNHIKRVKNESKWL